MRNPFRYFKTSPEVIRLAVMMYVRFPLSLRNVEELLHERGVDASHETLRFCSMPREGWKSVPFPPPASSRES
jgi:transposase-like protein